MGTECTEKHTAVREIAARDDFITGVEERQTSEGTQERGRERV